MLDLITGYSAGFRAERFWRYDGREGTLEAHEIPSRNPACPACAEEGLGDAVLTR